MPTHRGQMAFFAGHRKASEDHPVTVVRREFTEESGIESTCWVCEGMLNPVYTARGQAIVPVVGRLRISIQELFENARSNGEWTDLIAVRWDELTRESNWEWGWRHGLSAGKVLMIPLNPGSYLHQTDEHQKSFLLWGATARMVWGYLALYYRPQ